MSSVPFEALAQAMIDAGARIGGLSAGQIREVIEGQRLERLPSRYEEYLAVLGGDKTIVLFADIDCYPSLVDLKDEAQALLETEGVPGLLPDNAVVIGIHQGYAVYWLTDAALDDSPVQLYVEGDETVSTEWPTFTACVEYYAREAKLPWGEPA